MYSWRHQWRRRQVRNILVTIKSRKRSKVETGSVNFQNPLYIHDSLDLTSDMEQDDKLCITELFGLQWRYQLRHKATLNIALYIHI